MHENIMSKNIEKYSKYKKLMVNIYDYCSAEIKILNETFLLHFVAFGTIMYLISNCSNKTLSFCFFNENRKCVVKTIIICDHVQIKGTVVRSFHNLSKSICQFWWKFSIT